ncbi:MAG: hypothetical protein Q9187_001082 [Circinaria calcarea]
MTDPQPATKAPETDAAEGSIFPNDTPAQTGPSMGVYILVFQRPGVVLTESVRNTARPTVLLVGSRAPCYLPEAELQTASGAAPTGEISKIADVDVYITKPSDYPHSPSKLLLFLSSGTGIHSINNQLQADQYASEGFLVVMPDQFGGDPAPNSGNPNAVQEAHPSVIEQVKLVATETVQSFMLDMWLARQTPEKVMPILQKVVEGAKEEFADAVANGGGIYAVGYCFGGKYVLLLGSELPDAVAKGQAQKDEEQGVVKAKPLIRAGALAHATMVTKHDIEAVKSPISMACVENDPLFPDDIREAAQKNLEEKQIKHEIKVYPGVPHGQW